MSTALPRAQRVWTRREIEGQLAEGRKIIILDGQVIKADAWIPYHPGGEKAIQHFVGRDASIEIKALHSLEAQAHMQKFVIGRIEGSWTNFQPPIQGGVFRPLVKDGADESAMPEHSSDSSTSSSTPPSPLFEANSSPSSASSVSEAPLDAAKLDPIQIRLSAELATDLLQYPGLDQPTQEHIADKFRELESRVKAAGLFDCPYGSYAVDFCRNSLLFAAFLVALHYGYYALAGLFLGTCWHQLVFLAHDAGHIAITHNFQVDSFIGIFVANFVGGLSMGWWKHSHNVHHLVTNSPEHDPDIEYIPFLAVSTRFFSSLRSTYHERIMEFDAFARLAVSIQHWMYYPLLMIGRFNLYRLSWEYLLFGQTVKKGPAWWHRYVEIIGQGFFWAWFGYGVVYCSIPTAWDRFVFVMVSHLATSPLHVQITLSHFAMSTADLGVHETFPHKMLRTTMDVDCPQWLDFWFGGLQFQAVHHLFPRMPRHNFRKAQKYLKEFCQETGIPYVIYGFTDGNKKVVSHLGEVAKQVKIYEECRRAAAKDLIAGHHH